eukprot:983784-Amphidinium_carterae.2
MAAIKWHSILQGHPWMSFLWEATLSILQSQPAEGVKCLEVVAWSALASSTLAQEIASNSGTVLLQEKRTVCQWLGYQKLLVLLQVCAIPPFGVTP